MKNAQNLNTVEIENEDYNPNNHKNLSKKQRKAAKLFRDNRKNKQNRYL
jgi:hypothetical protein